MKMGKSKGTPKHNYNYEEKGKWVNAMRPPSEDADLQKSKAFHSSPHSKALWKLKIISSL